MLAVLQFIFASFWHFIGIVVLIYAIGEAASGIVAAFRRKPPEGP